MRITHISAIGAVAALGALASASHAAARPLCHDLDATIQDKVVAEGCPPPSQVCVIGTVRGNYDFKGTTVFLLGSRGEAPPTAPDQRPVSGTLTYALDDGSTVTALETSIGNVSPATGTGHAGGTQQFTGGTGRFEGATGFAYLAQHYETDHFVTEIHGSICRSSGE